jgi:hypothetical protein
MPSTGRRLTAYLDPRWETSIRTRKSLWTLAAIALVHPGASAFAEDIQIPDADRNAVMGSVVIIRYKVVMNIDALRSLVHGSHPFSPSCARS